jgi:hypothetical protein
VLVPQGVSAMSPGMNANSYTMIASRGLATANLHDLALFNAAAFRSKDPAIGVAEVTLPLAATKSFTTSVSANIIPRQDPNKGVRIDGTRIRRLLSGRLQTFAR